MHKPRIEERIRADDHDTAETIDLGFTYSLPSLMSFLRMVPITTNVSE